MKISSIALAAAVAAIITGTASQAQAQIQLTPDSARYLIQRTVGEEQWAISYNFDDGTLTGNVFHTDGQPPSFIYCEFTNIEYANDPADNQYTLDCWGNDPCEAAPCDPDWGDPIATDIPLPASFLLPPGTVATFGGNVNTVFTSSCALGGCHDSASSAGGLNLSPEAAYDSIVDRLSNGNGSLALVEPFNAGDSYLYRKIIGEDISGSPMPIGSMLDEETISRIGSWILEGAVRN